jgi:protease I
VLEGKTCIAYPAVQPDIEKVGGKLGSINETASNAVVDGNLVTAPAWPAHPEWIKKFLDLLGTKIEP